MLSFRGVKIACTSLALEAKGNRSKDSPPTPLIIGGLRFSMFHLFNQSGRSRAIMELAGPSYCGPFSKPRIELPTSCAEVIYLLITQAVLSKLLHAHVNWSLVLDIFIIVSLSIPGSGCGGSIASTLLSIGLELYLFKGVLYLLGCPTRRYMESRNPSIA